MGRGLGGEKGLTVQGLRDSGYEAVFVGIGLPDPKVAPVFEGLTVDSGFYTSKDFLPVVSIGSKPGAVGTSYVGVGMGEGGGGGMSITLNPGVSSYSIFQFLARDFTNLMTITYCVIVRHSYF